MISNLLYWYYFISRHDKYANIPPFGILILILTVYSGSFRTKNDETSCRIKTEVCANYFIKIIITSYDHRESRPPSNTAGRKALLTNFKSSGLLQNSMAFRSRGSGRIPRYKCDRGFPCLLISRWMYSKKIPCRFVKGPGRFLFRTRTIKKVKTYDSPEKNKRITEQKKNQSKHEGYTHEKERKKIEKIYKKNWNIKYIFFKT